MEQKEVFVDINNARSEEYRVVLQRIVDRGEDPFALENMQKEHTKPILKIGEYWYVTENFSIYPNAKYNFLIIARTYGKKMSDFPKEAQLEFFSILEEFIEIYDIKGGALCMRFGETSQTGATCKRLHAHVIESDLEKGTVVFPIGKGKKSNKKNC